MKPETVARLLAVNAGFYERCAESFSDTRQRIQPGIQRALSGWVSRAGRGTWLLDLGCGNGNLAAWLERQGYPGGYVGLDQSPNLLGQRRLLADRYQFQVADLSQPDWLAEIPGQPYERVVAFAVLHHLPGGGLRIRLLREIRRLLSPEGLFVFSVWQFSHSPRLAGRIQPWERVGMVSADVDEGDALLDWRAGAASAEPAYRYVHQFTEQELAALAGKCGFKVLESWHSDGQGSRLGLYQVWSRD